MSDLSGSFVKVSISLLQPKCNEMIQRIKIARELSDNDYLNEALKKHNRMVKWFGWFKWLGYQPRTREEMHLVIVNSERSYASCFRYPSKYAYESLDTAENILGMCEKSADGNVYLSSEDYQELFR